MGQIQPVTLKKTKSTLVQLVHPSFKSRYDFDIVRKYEKCDELKAAAFVTLLQKIIKINDMRLVKVFSANLTADGYYYDMQHYPKKLTAAENLLVDLYGCYLDNTLDKSDQIVLDRLSNKLPILYSFLEKSIDIYFDMVGHNLRKCKYSNKYYWIDLEGLQWRYLNDGRLYLAKKLVCFNFRTNQLKIMD